MNRELIKERAKAFNELSKEYHVILINRKIIERIGITLLLILSSIMLVYGIFCVPTNCSSVLVICDYCLIIKLALIGAIVVGVVTFFKEGDIE